MNLLSPKTQFLDFNDTVRFNFFWRVFLFGTCFALVFIVVDLFFNQSLLIYFIIAFFADVLVLIALWRKHKLYRIFAIAYFFLAFGIFSSSFFSNTTLIIEMHIQAILWMLMICLMAYFTLGWRWGTFFVSLLGIEFIAYYLFFLNVKDFTNSLVLVKELTTKEMVALLIELSVPLVVIVCTMYQYVKVNKKAINRLEKEKSLVILQDKEKTVLLQEIHHRVKNNLQIIVSLLRLQSEEIKSDEVKIAFQEAISRILVMAHIHKKMYEKESLVDIDVKDYLCTLIKNMLMNGGGDDIQLKILADFKNIDIERLIPIGLIINELVSNTMKHAFLNSKNEKCIKIILKGSQTKQFSMVYQDNGKWRANKGKSFGLDLVNTFTEQLDGNFERDLKEEGTTYYFSFLCE